jgi:tRNA threonylcarbamoyladenosine biosynthesis protein TsaE
MGSYISHSAAETEAFAEALARSLVVGSVIGLAGDLGAGKTQFVKGLARGLGITERVHSPTFALLNSYEGVRGPLFHLDLYRLETDQQVIDAGLEEYLHAPAGISVIEWVDRWRGPMPRGYRRFELETMDERTRRIIYDHPGD